MWLLWQVAEKGVSESTKMMHEYEYHHHFAVFYHIVRLAITTIGVYLYLAFGQLLLSCIRKSYKVLSVHCRYCECHFILMHI